MISEDVYYNIMCKEIGKGKTFQEIHKMWFDCFQYILVKQFRMSKKSCQILFYRFEMDNWTALHKENTKYKDKNEKQLLEIFFGECNYISDRASLDRVFRCHWLFRNAFHNELFLLEETEELK